MQGRVLLHEVHGRAAEARTLVYDGDCPICLGIVGGLVRARLLPAERAVPYQELEGEEAERLWEAGIRNEIAALERPGGGVRTGIGALLWILRDSWLGPLARLVDRRPLRRGLELAYRTIAYNRRILAPARPTQGPSCECDPDFHAGYRAVGIALSAGFAFAAALLFGAVARRTSPLGVALPLTAAWFAAAGLGLFLVRGGREGRERAWTFAGHVAVVAAISALPLVAASCIVPALDVPRAERWLLAAAFIASGAISAVLIPHRTLAQRLGRPHAFGWFVAVMLGMATVALLAS